MSRSRSVVPVLAVLLGLASVLGCLATSPLAAPAGLMGLGVAGIASYLLARGRRTWPPTHEASDNLRSSLLFLMVCWLVAAVALGIAEGIDTFDNGMAARPETSAAGVQALVALAFASATLGVRALTSRS